MRVLGVDPGSMATGFGVDDGKSGTFSHIAAGTIRTRQSDRRAQRLKLIYDALLALLDEYAPSAVSLERSFVAANVESAFRLGEVRAIVMLAAAQRGLALFEYTRTEVKTSVTSYGRADKRQVKSMVCRTLKLKDLEELSEDAADALALALCHLSRSRM